eukprot:222849-Hanusia_phi.AAC.2
MEVNEVSWEGQVVEKHVDGAICDSRGEMNDRRMTWDDFVCCNIFRRELVANAESMQGMQMFERSWLRNLAREPAMSWSDAERLRKVWEDKIDTCTMVTYHEDYRTDGCAIMLPDQCKLAVR